jgi:NAD(P)H dehydrogenase (quinone)
MLIVSGASGKLGRKIVENLLLHVPASRIGVSVRNPDRVADLQVRGVRVRQADYTNAESLRYAWRGATRLLLVSSNAAATGGNPVEQHATAIAIAREIGVERVLYTSQISSAANSQFPPGRDHAATEKLLAESGLAWTALRHGFYAESSMLMNARGLAAGDLAAPEDGKVAWTTHEDLATADAALLAGTVVIDGPTPPLTGSDALDLADLARLAGEIYGRPVSRTIISDESMVARARAAGTPEGVIAVMLGYYHAARAGEFAMVDPTLGSILRRETEPWTSFMIRASKRG